MKRFLQIAIIVSILGLIMPSASFAVPVPISGGYKDTETSDVNTFSAGTLDFSLPEAFSFGVLSPGGSATRNILIQNDGSLNFQYEISYQFIFGSSDLCNVLNLTVDGYSGPLSGLSNYGAPFDFSSTSNLDFVVSLPSGAPDALKGTSCQFKFIFDGWQDGIWGQGFNDTEETANTVSASYWNPPVVLNEFLPNAGEYPEFIEIYNKTGDAIDLSGFYIKADSNIIPIDTVTTNLYSGSSTVIPANGWLVVTTGDDLMNNTAGTITLYNPIDIVVDTYTYTASSNNVNNTPDWTNNLTAYLPFDGNLLDKSGNVNNGTSYGAISATGRINQGMSFDGINDYIRVADSASLDITGNITIESWIRPAVIINSANSNARIVDKQNAYYLLFDYPSADGRLRLTLRIGGNYVNVSSIKNSWNADQWYHIVGTYDGSEMKVYVDGVLENSTPMTGSIEASDYELFFGTRAVSNVPTNMFFNGLIDEVKIYSRALDSIEITEHYNAASFDGSVPVDKSYARIPDGDPNWVDPVPTPGGANIETIEVEDPIDELIEEIVEENTEDQEDENNEEEEDNGGIIEEIIENITDYLLDDQNNDEDSDSEDVPQDTEILVDSDETISESDTSTETDEDTTAESDIEDPVITPEDVVIIPEDPIVIPEGETDSNDDPQPENSDSGSAETEVQIDNITA